MCIVEIEVTDMVTEIQWTAMVFGIAPTFNDLVNLFSHKKLQGFYPVFTYGHDLRSQGNSVTLIPDG